MSRSKPHSSMAASMTRRVASSGFEKNAEFSVPSRYSSSNAYVRPRRSRIGCLPR